MRIWLTVLGLALGFSAHAQVTLQDFNWGADARFNVKIVQGNQLVTLRGELRDNSKIQIKKDLMTVDIRHYQQGFLLLAVSLENEELAYVFLIEGFASPFTVMNSRPIRARKLNVMAELEGEIDAFKKVSGFDVAQAMRKMAEYFAQNPTKKINDLYDALERDEAFVKILAKPKNTAGTNDQGVSQPAMPPKVAQGAAPVRGPGEPLDLNARPSDPPPGMDDDDQDPWVRQQRARTAADARRQRELMRQRQQQQVDAYGRPLYPDYPQDGSRGYYGNRRPPPQGQMQYDPSTGGYYRRPIQQPQRPYYDGYNQPPRPPGQIPGGWGF